MLKVDSQKNFTILFKNMESESQSDGGEKRPQFGGRHLKDAGDVFKHNAWDDVEWDEDQMAAAREKVEANARVTMTAEERARLEAEADKNWDAFYGTHQAGFFKDRNWLFTEFPELLELGGEKEVIKTFVFVQGDHSACSKKSC